MAVLGQVGGHGTEAFAKAGESVASGVLVAALMDVFLELVPLLDHVLVVFPFGPVAAAVVGGPVINGGEEAGLGHMVLAHHRGFVAGTMEKLHQGHLVLVQSAAVVAHAMVAGIATGEQRCPRWLADGVLHKVVGEIGGAGGQAVDVRGLDHWVAVAAEGVIAEVVGGDQEYVQRAWHGPILIVWGESCNLSMTHAPRQADGGQPCWQYGSSPTKRGDISCPESRVC